MSKNNGNDPFQLAVPTGKRAKILLYGDSGTGKTLLALSLGGAVDGKVAMIDLESGSDFYSHDFEFYRVQTTSLQAVHDTLEFIRANQHDYGLLLLDPITVLYNRLQREYVGKSGIVDPQGWNKVKAQMERLYESLLSLPIATVIIAREAAEYADGSGNTLKKIGVKPDCEKNGRFAFDATLRLWLRDGKRVITTEKDRSGTLADEIVEPGVADFVDMLNVGLGDAVTLAALEAAELFDEESEVSS